MYRDGLGVERDYRQVMFFFWLAANQGYANAQYNLAVMYDNGRGVQKDRARAVCTFVSWLPKTGVQKLKGT